MTAQLKGIFKIINKYLSVWSVLDATSIRTSQDLKLSENVSCLDSNEIELMIIFISSQSGVTKSVYIK